MNVGVTVAVVFVQCWVCRGALHVLCVCVCARSLSFVT